MKLAAVPLINSTNCATSGSASDERRVLEEARQQFLHRAVPTEVKAARAGRGYAARSSSFW